MQYFFPPSGNTYDRSIVVDDEDASIVLYDIWEQVSYNVWIIYATFVNFTLTQSY